MPVQNSSFGILFVVFCVVLVLPATPAQSALSDISAEAHATVGASGRDFRFSGLEDPVLGPAGGAECPGDPFQPLADGFVFRSTRTERACGAASWSLGVPSGAERVVVGFRSDRHVDADAAALDVHAEQAFAVHSRERGVVLERALFPPSSRSDSGSAFEYVLPLTGDADELTLVWWFRDEGAHLAAGPGSVPVGVHFEGSVAAVEVRFLGVGVPGLEAMAPTRVDDAKAAYVVRDVSFVIPVAWFEHWPGARIEVFVLARGGYDTATLVLPDGTALPREDLVVDASDYSLSARNGAAEDVCVVRVSSALTLAGGPGNYTVRFQYREATRDVPGGVLAGLGVIAIPSILLAVATGAVLTTTRGGKWVQRRGAAPLLGLLFGVAVVLYLADRGGPAGLARWPVAGPASGAFLLLAVVVLLSLGTLAATTALQYRRWRARQAAALRELERERKTREEAEEAIYSIVHDLKTPLIALEHLMADVRKGTGEEHPEELRDAVRRSQDVVREMNDLVAEMLAFMKEVGTAHGTGQIWLRPAMKDVVESLRPKIVAKGARIVVEPGADACLLVPPETVRHVLKNLLENAVKYGPDVGGVVRVSLRHAGSPSRPDALVLEVADNGSGIPAEDRERVFKLLTRLPDRQGRILPGTGVGLAIVQRVVTTQGGSVEIEDAPEGGALFRVRWPGSLVQRGKSQPVQAGWETEYHTDTPPSGGVGTGV